MNEHTSPSLQVERWRIYILYGLIIFIFGFYVIRLFDYQIVRGGDYLTQAEDNRKAELSVRTQRGMIYDRNGFVLARNIPSYNITITPALLPEDDGAIQEIYRQLSAVVGVPASSGEINDETVRLFKPCDTDLGISQIVFIADTLAPYNPVPIRCDVPEEIALIVKEKGYDWPGTGVEIEPVREYPTGWTTSEIIGFLDDDAQRQGQDVDGIPVLGPGSDPSTIARSRATRCRSPRMSAMFSAKRAAAWR